MQSVITAIILYLVSPAPNRELYRNEAMRENLADLFVEAGNLYNIDSVLLAYWSFKESSFRDGIVSKSKLKEYGLFQVHGVAKFTCKNELKHYGETLSTARGQVLCGAFLFRRSIDVCGSLRSGLGRYASGRCGYAQRLVRRRLKQVERLKRQFKEKK